MRYSYYEWEAVGKRLRISVRVRYCNGRERLRKAIKMRCNWLTHRISALYYQNMYAMAQLVKHKPEGRGFDSW